MYRNKLQRSIFAKRNKEYCKCIADPMICKEINGLVVRHVSFEELKPLCVMRHESVAFNKGVNTIYWGHSWLEELSGVSDYKNLAMFVDIRRMRYFQNTDAKEYILCFGKQEKRNGKTSHLIGRRHFALQSPCRAI